MASPFFHTIERKLKALINPGRRQCSILSSKATISRESRKPLSGSIRLCPFSDHCATFVDISKPEQYRAVDMIASEVADLAISLGGTLSGRHGDGDIRTPFLERLYGPEVYELFVQVKRTFNSKNIFNSGIIVGEQNSTILHDLELA